MDRAYIAIIIMVITMVLFLIDKCHVLVTALFCLLAMACTRIITWTEAFSGFNSQAVLLNITIMMMCAGLFQTGLADDIGNVLYRFTRKGEKRFVVVLWLIATICSAFVNCLVVMVLLMPILDIISVKSNGCIRRKMTYSVLAIGCTYGALCSTFTATSVITASSLLTASGYPRSMGPFESFAFGSVLVIMGVIILSTFGYTLMDKVYDFSEPRDGYAVISDEGTAQKKTEAPAHIWVWHAKKIFTAIVFITMIAAFVAGFDMVGASFIAVFLLLSAGCMDVKRAFQTVDWVCAILIACCLGFAFALEKSGASRLIADTFIKISGPLGKTQWGMFGVLMFIATLLSNFMSNNASVSLVGPIALSMAQSAGADAMGFMMAVAIGANLSVATPISVVLVTMSMSAGYKSKHILKINGMFNLVGLILCVVIGKLVYYTG